MNPKKLQLETECTYGASLRTIVDPKKLFITSLIINFAYYMDYKVKSSNDFDLKVV